MSGWVLSWIIGGAVVVIVVALLLLMIRGAGRAAAKADAIVEALHASRANTAGLWRVADTNATAERIVAAASGTRRALTDRQGSGS